MSSKMLPLRLVQNGNSLQNIFETALDFENTVVVSSYRAYPREVCGQWSPRRAHRGPDDVAVNDKKYKLFKF